MAPVIRWLKNHQSIECRVCVTAQHREMLDQVLELFEIKPDYDLDLMRPQQTLVDINSDVLRGVHKVLGAWRPDWVLVHGDTTTTLSAAFAAYYHRISVGHVEAGLRTRDIYSPWPEEVNRKATAAIAKVHFAPTHSAKSNLLAEHIPAESIHVTGNTVIDALLETVKRIDVDPLIKNGLAERFSFLDFRRRTILVTGHRRENFGAGFENICMALADLSDRADVQIVYPMHMNPNVREPVQRILGRVPNVFLIEPLEYLPFVYLMQQSTIILTDSGGIQEEAPSLGKPVLVMRETTERPEAVDAGVVRLVGTSRQGIVTAAELLLDNQEEYSRSARLENPYGDGYAARRIGEFLTK